MDWLLLFFVILIILVLFIAISIIKKLFKVAFILGIIFVILYFITQGAILNDFDKIKNVLPGSSVEVLLDNDGDIIAGFTENKTIELLENKELVVATELYLEGKLKELKGNNYKLFIIRIESLKEIEKIKINNKEVLGEELIKFFIENVPIESITLEDITIELDIEGTNMKSALLAYLYEKELKPSKSPIFFFKNYKEKNIVVYPETIFFKFTKIIPLTWIDEKINKLKDSIEEKAKNAITGALVTVKEKIKEGMD